MLEDDTLKLIRNLVMGERVLVSTYLPGKYSKPTPSSILAVFHHHCSSIRLLDIYTTHQAQPLRLTPTHLVLVRKFNTNVEKFQYASEVSIGDFLFSSALQPQRVFDIKEIVVDNTTVYAPLTFEGTIVTNNLIASCYGTYSHNFIHVLTTPVRWWYRTLLEVSNQSLLQELTTIVSTRFLDAYLLFLDCISSLYFID